MQDSPTLGDILTWAEKLCIHTCQETHTFTQIWWLPAAPGRQDGASCYRGPMTLLIPSWPSLRSLPHIIPINRTALRLILPDWLLSSTTFFFTWGPSTREASDSAPPAACHRYMTPEALNPLFMRSRFQTFNANAITHQTPDSQSLKHNKAGPVFPLFRNWHLNFCNKYQPCPGSVWSLGTQATLHNCSGPVSDSNLQQWADGAPLHTAAWHTPPKKCYLHRNIE